MALAHPRPSLRALGGALLTGLLLGSGAAVPAAHAVPTRAELRKKIDKQAAALKQVTEDYNAAREELAADEKTIAQLNKRLPGLRAQADGARAQFAEAASASYKISDLQQASVILADARGDEVMRRLGAIDQLTRRRQDKVGALTAAQRSLAADQQRLTTEAARQKIKVTDLRKRRDKIKKDLDDFYALRERAYGAREEGGGGYSGSVPKVSGQAGAVVTFAYRAIGKPYRFGEAGPDGYDCSGLTLAAWRQAGKSLPHNARMQWNQVAHLERGALAPGDLVFYTDLSHVGVYVGSGKVIHAPTFGQPVKIAPIGMMAIYGYGRPR